MLTEALAAGVGTDTYNFGTNFMAAVSAACIVPPLITTFAVIVARSTSARRIMTPVSSTSSLVAPTSPRAPFRS